MSLRYRKRLLEHLKHEGYTPRSVGHLREDLRVSEDDWPEFDGTVKSMAAEGVLEVSASGYVMLRSLATAGGSVVGRFRKAMKGFGFVEPEIPVREGSVFVPAEETLDALSGDTVRVQVRRDSSRSRPGEGPSWSGTIVEVVKRRRSSFAGELVRRGDQWLVFPDGREMTEPIVVRDAAAKNAPEGSKVIVEIVAYPQGSGPGSVLGEGVITRVLGDAGKPDVETQAVILAYDLPGEHPPECEEQAREVTQVYDRQIAEYQRSGIASFDKEGWGGRADLTGEFILTIDPPDAKDYDDAISIKRLPSGGWELGVHIADVAHFIPPGSAIDEEARDRCNSVYLPRRVIPMIPELLSNGICSLQEGVLRFCKSAFMTYDAQGVCKSEGVRNTLIKSAKRLTYLEAQALIDGDFNEARKHAKTPPRYTDQLLEALKEMDACARAIQGRRQRQGMISLELPEVVLIYDDNGHVVDAEREDSAFTHTLIEMFMVEANEVVARLFEKMDVPLLRRTHPDPTPGDVDNLRKAAMVAGFKIPKSPTREELQSLLNATRGTPASRAVHMAVLRTLSKAEYSPALIGHFALASTAYAHFTSPIRRYADLTVHRAIAEYLRRTDNATHRPRNDDDRKRLGAMLRESEMCPDEETLVGIGKHATLREGNAEEAERSLRQFLVLQLLEKHVGESFRGIITGVSPKGVFVQIEKFLAEGFVKKEDLPGDVTRENLTPFWKIDPRTGAMVDARSGRSYNMGDTVSVKVVAVDLPTRRMELVVDAAEGRAAGKAKKIPEGGLKLGGGFAKGQGAGFGSFDRTGSQRRSQKSKSRDKGKPNWRRDKG